MKISTKINNKVPLFLDKLYQKNGFFSWSLNNDLYDSKIKWGLANTVFAVKLLSILKANISESQKKEIINFIKSFENKNGSINDPLVYKKTFIHNKLISIRSLNFSNFFNQMTIMAETRQAFSVLYLLNSKPEKPFVNIPYTKKLLEKFIKSLYWDNIWAAASHIGHEVFFLEMNSDLFNYKSDESKSLIQVCMEAINSIQNKVDGMWHKSGVSTKQKVNAAMKMISTFNIIKMSIPMPDKIIDFILKSESENYYYDGCDNLNAIFVVKYAFDSCDKNYKPLQVKEFAERSLLRFEKYFFEESGGFSFLPSSFPRNFYGLQVTDSFKGPDIHGTFLMTWAVALCSSILQSETSFNADIIN
ncbi:MAG: hypothetical protein ACD_79C01376G0003 [uncultured bacterium]|nr:MAG: hypothetical protein ACD_79C01376G0003 [uncultured bacterium]